MYSNKVCLGWREWVGLPNWKIHKIKAKLDSGAKTSALHAEEIKYFRKSKKTYVSFRVFPKQKSKKKSRLIKAELLGFRKIKSSDGVMTERPVVKTDLCIGLQTWPIEITLINRDIMGYRLLIGRRALSSRAVIDPSRSYLAKKGTLVLIGLL